MQEFKILYLKDSLIKKILGSEDKNIRNYVARIIAHTTGIPIEEFKDNLELMHPDIGSNIHIVNSIGDVPFYNEKK